MILDLTLEEDLKTGKMMAESTDYDPSQEVKDRTLQVMQDFGVADTLRNKPYFEFNMYSLVTRMNQDQMSWNAYVSPPSSDPAEAWKSQAFRPIVRNKIITIAAHITASIIFPKIYAQNENDQEDQDAATVMRDIMEWVNDQSGYEKTFMTAILDAMINPAAFIHTEYAEKYRDIKIRDENGNIQIKRVLDELFSGFQDAIVSADELWIADYYEANIQKQPYIIWRKVIDYSTAQAKYHGNEVFDKYVKPGVQFLYSDMRNLFYQVYDNNLSDRLVEEVVYYNREADLQLTFVNGLLLDDVDNPNPRLDKNYPFVKMYYEMISDRFFYGKSLTFKLSADESVINTAYRMVIDGTYLQIMPPAVVFGSETVGNSVIAPGAVTTISNDTNPNASFQTIATNNNLAAGMNLINLVTQSISESSIDIFQQGTHRTTAFVANMMEENAKTLLGLFGKMVAFMVKDFGLLRISDILQFLTVGEAAQLLDDETGPLKFRSFLLPEKSDQGKTKTRKIQFDMNLPSETMIPKDKLNALQWDVFDEQKQMNDSVQIFKVNPDLFRSLKFKIQVNPEAIAPKSDALMKAAMLEEYGFAMQNPITDKTKITRDLLLGAYDKTKDDPDSYLMQQPENAAGAAMMGMQPGGPPPSGAGPESGLTQQVMQRTNVAQPSANRL